MYTKIQINAYTICVCHVVAQQYIIGIKQNHFKCNQDFLLFLHLGE
jgi:hypothetical protein